MLGNDQKISARRSTVLLNISRSWTALAHQLEHLKAIVKEESKAASVGGLRLITNPSFFGSAEKRGVLIPLCSRLESGTFREIAPSR